MVEEAAWVAWRILVVSDWILVMAAYVVAWVVGVCCCSCCFFQYFTSGRTFGRQGMVVVFAVETFGWSGGGA